MNKPIYQGMFKNIETVYDDFQITSDDLKDEEVILASYIPGSYGGQAFVLFKRDGQYYEVNAYHCSCFGLERQFEPEVTFVPALKHRATNGRVWAALTKDPEEQEWYAETVRVIMSLPEDGETK